MAIKSAFLFSQLNKKGIKREVKNEEFSQAGKTAATGWNSRRLEQPLHTYTYTLYTLSLVINFRVNVNIFLD